VAEGDWNASPLTISIPPFLGPTDPGYIIGPDIPAELVAFFAAQTQTIINAIIRRFDGDFYFFEAMVLEAPGGDDYFVVEGHVLSGSVTVDSYTHFDTPTNLASYQIAVGDEIYQIRVGGQEAGMAQLLIDYLSGADTIRVGNLNTHLIADCDADTILIEADDSINMGGFNNHVIVDQAGDTILIECDDRVRIDGGGKGFESETMRHSVDEQNTASTRTLTTYANLTNIAGTSFVAPESGIVTIHWQALITNNTVASGGALTPWVGTGSTVGAGTEVLVASDVNATSTAANASSAGARAAGVKTVTGLTAGDTYNVSIRGRAITGGTATFDDIHTTVVPSP
jgi:hypothetical protein